MLSAIDLCHGCSKAMGQRARDQARAGFTLVELVMVLMLVVILSGLAVPSLSGLGRAKANITATQVRSLFVFSQQWAIGTGRPTWVGYDASSKTINAFQARADNTTFAWRVALKDPMSKAPMAVDLSELFRDDDPIAKRYGGRLTMKFDSTGTPVDSSDVPLTNDIVVPLDSGTRIGIVVRAGTGLISSL